ncbi:hypothetical protein [Geobacillus subterraneus]|uniref:hypothetical protein n=1 Tax=Geobacillus subterraneus TaxID=129338 RepID=UPI00155618AB|nr:hypothetical protein [Geobacillus subterraneus]
MGLFSFQEAGWDKKMMVMLHEFGVSRHALKKEFERLLNDYLRQWDHDIVVKLKCEPKHPSFVIVYEDRPILVFDIHEKTFVDRRATKSIEAYESRVLEMEKEWKELRRNLQVLQNVRKNPRVLLRYMDGPWWVRSKNWITGLWHLTVHKQRIDKELTDKIEKLEMLLEAKKQEFFFLKKQQEAAMSQQSKDQKKFEFWRQRFLDWGYAEKELDTNGLC